MLRQAMLRVFVGVVCGLATGWFLARWLRSMLFAVQPHDPAIYGAVAAVLAFSSLVALLVPARRVFKINPATALRAE